MTFGLLPLLAYVFPFNSQFVMATTLTGASLFTVGATRGKVWWKSGLEMVCIGGSASSLAFIVGHYAGKLN